MRDGIQAWLSLDFSIIFEAWNPRTTKLKRYIPKDEYWSTYGSYTSLRSSIVTRLIKEPEQGLIDLNLNPDNYYIEKRKYSGGLIINGREASPFAVVIFRHRDPGQWYSGFRCQNLEWLTAYFERGNCEEETFADSETTEEGDIEFPFGPNIEDGDISFNPDELERMTPSQPSETEDDIPF